MTTVTKKKEKDELETIKLEEADFACPGIRIYFPFVCVHASARERAVHRQKAAGQMCK